MKKLAENSVPLAQEQPATGRGPGRPFKKGASGNPGGRPKVIEGMRQVLDDGGIKAVQRMVALVDDTDPKVAIAAARDVIDRVLGKAREAGDDGKRNQLAAFFAGVMARMGPAEQQAAADAAEDGEDA